MTNLAEFREAGYAIPPRLQSVLLTDPNDEPYATLSAAIAYARSGLPVLPCEPDSKKPLTLDTFRHGSRSATTDYETVRDAFYEHPDANIAVAPESDWIIIDVDPQHGGSLELAERIGIDVHGYRERSPSGGHHIPSVMPHGVMATASPLLAPGIQAKGPGSYAVSPHSRYGGQWYRPEPDRGIWRWAHIDPRSEHLAAITREASEPTSLIEITEEDRLAAGQVLKRLLTGKYAEGVNALYNGGWPAHFPNAIDTSESTRDYLLLLEATHFLRGCKRAKNILAALLFGTGWPQSKTRRNPKANPGRYVAIVVSNALQSRAFRDEQRVEDLRAIIDSNFHGSAATESYTLIPATISPKRRTLLLSILAFAAVPGLDDYSREGGWRRIPVEDFGRAFGKDPETIRLALKDLERLALIERRVDTYRHDRRPRKDSLIRVTAT